MMNVGWWWWCEKKRMKKRMMLLLEKFKASNQSNSVNRCAWSFRFWLEMKEKRKAIQIDLLCKFDFCKMFEHSCNKVEVFCAKTLSAGSSSSTCCKLTMYSITFSITSNLDTLQSFGRVGTICCNCFRSISSCSDKIMVRNLWFCSFAQQNNLISREKIKTKQSS